MNKIITVGRQFGSGGREIGRRLSEKLGIAYYDREIVAEIAKRTQLSEEYVKSVSESRPIASFPIHTGTSLFTLPNAVFQQNMVVYAEQHKILLEMAEKSDCVIVGRCADYVLREFNPFRIFVYADEQSKLQRCMSRMGDNNMTERELKRKMVEMDKNRAGYYSFFSGNKWGDKDNYDLMLNTSNADIKAITEHLANYVKDLFKQ